MANIKSAKKRIQLSIVRAKRNRAVKSQVKTAVKRYLTAIEQKDVSAASSLLRQAVSFIDKANSKGVIHGNTASRKKSRLSLKLLRLVKENEQGNQNASVSS